MVLFTEEIRIYGPHVILRVKFSTLCPLLEQFSTHYSFIKQWSKNIKCGGVTASDRATSITGVEYATNGERSRLLKTKDMAVMKLNIAESIECYAKLRIIYVTKRFWLVFQSEYPCDEKIFEG